MPLTAKGKKLKAKFKEQYGKKKGESVFYAMENSGKLKGVVKAKGGGLYQGVGGYGTKSSSKKSTSTGGGTTYSPHSSTGYVKSSTPTKTQIQKARDYRTQQNLNKQKGPQTFTGAFKQLEQKVGNMLNKAGSAGTKMAQSFMSIPFNPLSLGIKGLKGIENTRRAKRAKGEFFLSKKVELPATRDFYKVNKRPLDTKIGGKDEDYLKAAGITGGPKPPAPDFEDNKQVLCPDGTLPPCVKPTTTTPTTTISKNLSNDFLSGFRAYSSGGVSKGPPPKRGPNPQVPPVKMKNGKMTKKYKMSCPHRPDGIRGVGASIRGHKFIGVK